MRPYIILKKKGKARKGNRFPLVFKINIQRKPFTRALENVYVPETHWDPEAMKVKRGLQEDHFPDYSEYCNLKIGQALARANEILRYYHLQDGVVLTREIFAREYDQEASRGDFLAYMEAKIEQEYERRVISPATRDQQMRIYRKLLEWAGQVPFSSVNRDWLERFDLWHLRQLRADGYEGGRERERALKYIRKYLGQAQQEGKRFSDPFTGFRWPKYHTRYTFLSEDEIRKCWTLFRDSGELFQACVRMAQEIDMSWHHREQWIEAAPERMKATLRAFLFQCHTGLRYSDLKRVTHSHIQEGAYGREIVLMPKKTKDSSGMTVRIPIGERLRELIQQDGPFLVETVSNQKYNDRLKELASLIGTRKVLTTHVGRHTFASLSLARGVSLEVLQRLMGLSNIRTLMIYVHVSDDRLRDEYFSAWEE